MIALGALACALLATSLRGTHDLSTLPWPEAFDRTIHLLERDYALTDWKQIDWREVHARHKPAIMAAHTSRDWNLGYLAWRRFVHETFADGHVGFDALGAAVELEQALAARTVGGHFGLEVARCDDGRVIVVSLDDDLRSRGLEWGAEVVSWNGRDVEVALASVDLTWAPNLSTTELRNLYQERLLPFDALGATATLIARNPGGGSLLTLPLAAKSTDALPILGRMPSPPVSAFATAMRGDGIAVLTLRRMMPDDADPARDPFPVFEQKALRMVREITDFIRSLQTRGARGLIIDLRGHLGGWSPIGAGIVAAFPGERRTYTRIVAPDTRSGEWRERERLEILPLANPFQGPVIVLVDPDTISAGEGLAYHLACLPHCQVLGRFGTPGTFANSGGSILLAGGFGFRYPVERCVDDDGTVMIESDGHRGGITPGIRVPRTPTTWYMKYVEQRDVEMETAIATLTGMYGPDGDAADDRLINLSSRSLVGTGDHVAIAGFVLAGETGVLVRAIGPTLAMFGVKDPLQDPTLHLFRNGELIASNDTWGRSEQLQSICRSVGAFPIPAGEAGDREAMIYRLLPAGAYTAVMAHGGTAPQEPGAGLLEVYLVEASNTLSLPADP